MLRMTIVALALLAAAAPALAVNPPYLKLAQALGTPDLAFFYRVPDGSQMLLKFVAKGETKASWTKMTTVSIARVSTEDTPAATRGVIDRLRSTLEARHAHIDAFDRSGTSPVSAYFEFSADGETQKGIVYSPDPGFVTVAQVGSKGTGKIRDDDVKKLKSVIAR